MILMSVANYSYTFISVYPTHTALILNTFLYFIQTNCCDVCGHCACCSVS